MTRRPTLPRPACGAALIFLFMILGTAAPSLAAAEWSYSGTKGPDAWGRLHKDWATCDKGQQQSPIDIALTDPVRMHKLHLNYNVTGLDLVNMGHSIQQKYNAGSMLTIAGKSYMLLQFHIHTPSEHTVMGRQDPLEIHFVHKSEMGELAVIAVLVQAGKTNTAALEIWPHLPLEKGQKHRNENIKINARDLIPHDQSFYRYMGSLTTPPCSEGVHWYAMKNRLEMSAAQIKEIRGLIGQSNRPVQARNHRIILDSEE